VAELVGGHVVRQRRARSAVGAPGQVLPGWAVALPAPYAARCGRGTRASWGRVERDRCLLDLRCIDPGRRRPRGARPCAPWPLP
jgi:L-seryl-tRNA(Ser) seleniumtransferase